mmetsp:Transcript_43947/g.87166  ORF Transcript_43947/g.87166 Transcript_43947/m.87166 type:complete len:103 (+) Transcript_43947:494-802(+)
MLPKSEEAVFEACSGRRAIPKFRQRSGKPDKAGEAGIDAKKQEKLLIVETNAVVEPGAVVIHAQDAHLADEAMVRSLRTWHVALFAVGCLPRLPLWSRRRHW